MRTLASEQNASKLFFKRRIWCASARVIDLAALIANSWHSSLRGNASCRDKAHQYSSKLAPAQFAKLDGDGGNNDVIGHFVTIET
jgi:hypothetical protein